MNIKTLRLLLKEDEEKLLALASPAASTESLNAIIKLQEQFKDQNENNIVSKDNLLASSALGYLDDNSALLKAIKNEDNELHTALTVLRRLQAVNSIPEDTALDIALTISKEEPDIAQFLFRILLNPKCNVQSVDVLLVDDVLSAAHHNKNSALPMQQLEEIFCLLGQQEQLTPINCRKIDTILSRLPPHKKNQHPMIFPREQAIASLHDTLIKQTEATTTLKQLHPCLSSLLSNKLSGETKNKIIDTLIDSILPYQVYYSIYRSNSTPFSEDFKRHRYQRGNHNEEHILLKDIQMNMPRFVTALNQARIYPADEFWLTFFTTRPTKHFSVFQETIIRLSEKALLTQESFDLAIKRLSEKLPPVTEATIVAETEEQTKLPLSQITVNPTIASHALTFFYPGNITNCKSFNKNVIIKGYKSPCNPSATHPNYAIKGLFNQLESPPLGENITINYGRTFATREVKSNRLLQRTAEYFTIKKNQKTLHYAVTEWLPGDTLTHTHKQLAATSYKNRLKCCTSILSDLNTLHQHNRIHGDIKPDNCIVDLASPSMRLIDFADSLKFGSSRICGNLGYLLYDHDHMYADVYSVGMMLTLLFPELYKPESYKKEEGQENKVKIVEPLKTTSDMTLTEKAISQLIACMINPNTSLRCSSEDAYQYCCQLLDVLDQLDDAKLQDLATSTIARTQVTVEDVLREARIEARR